MLSRPQQQTQDVRDVFAAYEGEVRTALLALRELVLETAAATPGVGRVEETLRWGQPSYVTSETRSGSTIRVAPTPKKSKHDYAMYFICHTNLVETFKTMFGESFSYDGDRAITFNIGDQIPENELRECIAMALTYHLNT